MTENSLMSTELLQLRIVTAIGTNRTPVTVTNRRERREDGDRRNGGPKGQEPIGPICPFLL